MSVDGKKSNQTSRVWRRGYSDNDPLRKEQVRVLTVGQKKHRRIRARLSHDVGVESRIVGYIGVHNIAAPNEVKGLDIAVKRSTSWNLLIQPQGSMTYHGDRAVPSLP
jgi:hypothetical protein